MLPKTEGSHSDRGTSTELNSLLREVRSVQKRRSVGKLAEREIALFYACIRATQKMLDDARVYTKADMVAHLAGHTTGTEYEHHDFGRTGYAGPYTSIEYKRRLFKVTRFPPDHTWYGASGQCHPPGVIITLTVSEPTVDYLWIHRLRSTVRTSLELSSIASVAMYFEPDSDRAIRVRFHVSA
jgi:hypothetical protein